MGRLNLIKYIFLLVGAGLAVGAAVMAARTATFVNEAARAEGTVLELVRARSRSTSSRRSISYAPVVRFTTADGETIEFQSRTSSYPPAYVRGERVTVLYRPEAPHDATIQGFFSLWLFPLMLGSIGGMFLLFSGGFVLSGVLARRRRERLRRHGIGIDTELQGVERNTGFKLGGRSPFRVITQWQNPATGEIHVFKSENLWFDPSAYIRDNKVRVLIEHGNPRRYHVDLSFLPKMAQ